MHRLKDSSRSGTVSYRRVLSVIDVQGSRTVQEIACGSVSVILYSKSCGLEACFVVETLNRRG